VLIKYENDPSSASLPGCKAAFLYPIRVKPEGKEKRANLLLKFN
jgi:hypothetical protein